MARNLEFSNNYYQDNWLHGKFIMYFGIIILIIGGIVYWKHHNNYQDHLANKNFNIILYAMSINDNLTIQHHAMKLLDQSNRTPYPRLTGLILAKTFMMENNFPEAEKILTIVINKQPHKDGIWHLTNLRLIKVLLLQNKFSEAETRINLGMTTKKFLTSYQELFGDLLVAKNKLSEASQKYLQAMENLPTNVVAPWLQLKINNLSE